MNLTTPLQIVKGRILKNNNVVSSINRNIDRLLHTPTGSVLTDPDYGFVFTALRFEVFNEYEGVVQTFADDDDPLYQKKISGSSKNLQTFASDLNSVIQRYEPRLSDTSSVMTYMRTQREINIAIRGTITRTGEIYEYQTIIKVWN